MKVAVRIIGLCFLLNTATAQAIEITAEGYGADRDKAKKQAMANLSQSLVVEIKSETRLRQDQSGNRDASQEISTKSELPLLGVDTSIINKQGEFFCIASLDSSKSLGLYETRLNKLDREIRVLYNKQKNLKNNPEQRYKMLSQILTDIDLYQKYHAIAQLLGSNVGKELPITSAEINSELMDIEDAAPSLSIAAELLSRDLDKNRYYYIYPATPQGSEQATKLSRILRDKLAAQLKTVGQHDDAEFIIKGSYEILDEGIAVTYRALDALGVTQAANVIKLAPAAYRNMDYKPKSVSFEKLLHEGYVVSNDFRAELNTNLGKHDLLFTEGETIELFIKLNKPGYFYIISHNTDKQQSYLLELNAAPKPRKFITFVNADNVNRWISLGEFEATPPFGVENLQMVASNRDLAGELPANSYDRRTGLYLLSSETSKEAVRKTRGLKPKKKDKVQSAEASLTFTTMPK